MKFSHSVILAALLGSLTFTEVQSIQMKQSEAQRLMESIDVDMEALHKKHKKHHKKAKKHHKKAHAKVQTTASDDAEGDAANSEDAGAKAAAAKAATDSANAASKAAGGGADSDVAAEPKKSAKVEKTKVDAKVDEVVNANKQV